jgi:hypothetical protein
MNTGQASIEWLYSEKLRVDEEWSVRTPRGFKWWADKNAQTIEIIGDEHDPDLGTAYYLSIRTELIKNLEFTELALSILNDCVMAMATMSGPVYNAENKTLDLCSLVRVHDGNYRWVNPLLSLASVMQIGEVSSYQSLIDSLDAAPNSSGHPRNGIRPEPDELVLVTEILLIPEGIRPCKWTEKEFQQTVDEYMQRPPSLLATGGGLGFTVEFPFGNESSLFRAAGNQRHPRYGNGLLLLQSFPLPQLVTTAFEGISLALFLNECELTQRPIGYGSGSYTYRSGAIHHTSFIPNAAYRANMLPNFYHAAANRASEMSRRLLGETWTAESFNPEKSAIARMMRAATDKSD